MEVGAILIKKIGEWPVIYYTLRENEREKKLFFLRES
jgi:hypothetical protein